MVQTHSVRPNTSLWRDDPRPLASPLGIVIH